MAAGSRFRIRCLLLVVFAVCLYGGNAADAGPLKQISGVLHIHTTFSSGHYSVAQLAEKAKNKGIEVLAITDHDCVEMEYGIFPLRNIIKVSKDRPSVLQAGADKYLDAIAEVNRKQSDVLVIPGVQSSPFYYWTGTPLTGKLTAHNFRKELLVIGIDAPEAYEALPVLHNGLSFQHVRDLMPRFLIFGAAFLLSLFLLTQSGWSKRAGILLALASLLLMINFHPFRSSRFDPYHGDAGIDPYQDVIDYAEEKGGMVFWAHPESNYSAKGRDFGPIRLKTRHYPEVLLESENYTGFSAVYGDTISITKPGRQWDTVLQAFCAGERKRPVWGVGGADFHIENAGVELDTYQTVLWVEQKTMPEIKAALSQGRCYAVFKKGDARIVLERFELNAPGGEGAVSGQTLLSAEPKVSLLIRASDNQAYPIDVSIVVNGHMIYSVQGQTPLSLVHPIDLADLPPHTYCRIIVESRVLGKLISNPIFVKVSDKI